MVGENGSEKSEHGRWSNVFAMGFDFSRTLMTPDECLEEPFGGPRVRGGSLDGNLFLVLKAPLSESLP